MAKTRYCFIFVLLSFLTFDRICSNSYGPFNWLERLSAEEMAEINEKCAYNSPSESLTQTNVNDRVYHGEFVPPGKYKFHAVFVRKSFDPDRPSETICGATFISRKHLLTSRHCFISPDAPNQPPFTLMAGGVCHSANEFAGCPSVDMIEINYDFAIFSFEQSLEVMRDPYKGLKSDFAIIQLSASVPKEYDDRIEFACLPKKYTKDPKELIVLGFGRTEFGSATDRLKESKVLTSPDATSRGLAPECRYEPNRICTYPLSHVNGSIETSIGQGDSGGPSVFQEIRSDKQIYTLFGVIAAEQDYMIDPPNGKRFIMSLLLTTKYYLADICYYLNLCVPGLVQPTREPWIQLGSIYSGKARRQYASIPLFRMLDDASDDKMRKRCQSLSAGQKRLKRQSESPMPYPGNPPPWSAVIVYSDYDNKLDFALCGASFVTTSHLITSRGCARWMHHGKSNGTFKVLAGGSCLREGPGCESKDMVDLEIDFIAWSVAKRGYASDLAIIQLAKDVGLDNPKIQPACFINSKDEVPEHMITYGWGKSLSIAHLYYIDLTLAPDSEDPKWEKCRPLVCGKSDRNFSMDHTDRGHGVISADKKLLVGMHLMHNLRLNVYQALRMDTVLGVLCTYLNRCQNGVHDHNTPDILINPIPWFTEFYRNKN